MPLLPKAASSPKRRARATLLVASRDRILRKVEVNLVRIREASLAILRARILDPHRLPLVPQVKEGPRDLMASPKME